MAGRARLARLGFDLVEVKPKASSWEKEDLVVVGLGVLGLHNHLGTLST